MVNSIGPARSGRSRGTAPGRTPPAPREGPQADVHKVSARIVDASGRPISGARYEVVDPSGAVVAQGTTDWQGTARHDVQAAGSYTVRVLEVPDPPPPADAAGEGEGGAGAPPAEGPGAAAPAPAAGGAS